jgi:NADH-quinone oxidoreductase subunit J
MLVGQAFFGLCAALAVIGALSTVIAKNPIRGAMGLLLMIVAIAGLFLALHAQFLAAVQLIVYAGAIVVLFLFVIMLLGPAAQAPHDSRGKIVRTLSGALFAGVGLTAAVYAWRSTHQVDSDKTFQRLLDTPAADFGSIDTIGRVLFSDGLVPFELSSGLLMVAIVGAVAVARGKHKTDEAHGEILNSRGKEPSETAVTVKEVTT